MSKAKAMDPPTANSPTIHSRMLLLILTLHKEKRKPKSTFLAGKFWLPSEEKMQILTLICFHFFSLLNLFLMSNQRTGWKDLQSFNIYFNGLSADWVYKSQCPCFCRCVCFPPKHLKALRCLVEKHIPKIWDWCIWGGRQKVWFCPGPRAKGLSKL